MCTAFLCLYNGISYYLFALISTAVVVGDFYRSIIVDHILSNNGVWHCFFTINQIQHSSCATV